MRRTLIALLLILAIACDNPLPTMPSPPPSPPPVVTRPPRVDQDYSWSTYQGIIAFGLGHPGQSEEDVLAFVSAAMMHGWNTFQVCSETEYWDGPGYPTKPRDIDRLVWTLDILARVPGAQVALVGNCTLKRQVSLQEQFDWAVQVADAAAQFRNVAIFTHNEFDNCAGRDDWGGNRNYCAGKNEVARHVQMYRGKGFLHVTADDSIGPRVPGDSEAKTFTFRLANIGANPASFHPQREHKGQPWDPDVKFLQKLARYNGDFVLSETVAWMDYSGRCDGLRTCDKLRLDNLIGNCAAVTECKMTYHCENCLAGEVPTYIPRAQ